MLTSDMAGQVNRYMTDRALFNSDITNKATKWSVNYVHPLAMGYRAAQLRLNRCISDAQARAAARDIAYQQLKARIDLATGIVFALIGPFSASAIAGLSVTQAEMENTVLTKWYSSRRDQTLKFDDLLESQTIRQRVLNLAIDRGVTIGMAQAQANTSPPAPTPQTPPSRTAPPSSGRVGTPSNFTLPDALLTGEFAPAEFEQNVQSIFNGFAVDLHDRYLRLFEGPADQKRAFLDSAVRSTLACPPPEVITNTIPPTMLESQLFGMIAGSYIFSFTPNNGRIWPNIGYDLADAINTALNATGNSAITNNPQLGAFERNGPGGVTWDGTVQPNAQVAKIREINLGNAAVLQAYMQAIAATNAVT